MFALLLYTLERARNSGAHGRNKWCIGSSLERARYPRTKVTGARKEVYFSRGKRVSNRECPPHALTSDTLLLQPYVNGAAGAEFEIDACECYLVYIAMCIHWPAREFRSRVMDPGTATVVELRTTVYKNFAPGR